MRNLRVLKVSPMVKFKWLTPKGRKGRMGLSYTDKHVSVVVVRTEAGKKPLIDYAEVSQVSLTTPYALKSIIASAALSSLPCNAVLNVDQYQILQVDKPNMPEAEIKAALKWKVKELLDYQVVNATVDGVEIPADPQNPNRMPYMFAICAKNQHLADVSNQILDAGINLKSIDVQALAQRNVAALLEVDGRVLVSISVTERGCLFTFTANGELYHTRFVELDRGFLIDQQGELFDSNLERLVLELQRSLDSFDRQFPFLSIQRIVIMPVSGGARLVEALQTSLYLPVETFNLTDLVVFEDGKDYSSLEKQAMLMPALGAALREEVAA